jgi:hypothetical protein
MTWLGRLFPVCGKAIWQQSYRGILIERQRPTQHPRHHRLVASVSDKRHVSKKLILAAAGT